MVRIDAASARDYAVVSLEVLTQAHTFRLSLSRPVDS
jgi:hypothetical protein